MRLRRLGAPHVDGQLASADYGGGKAERFTWDGLALVRRGDAKLINEPHVGGGNPVVSSLGATYFNDILGTTVGARRRSRYAANSMTAFGEGGSRHAFFTGKPQVDGLGHAFLFRNYRASLAKWQTADPMGYPDGWNRLAYCKNGVVFAIDFLGSDCTDACSCDPCKCGVWVVPSLFGDGQHYFMGRDGVPLFNPKEDFMRYLEDNFPYAHYFAAVHDSWVDRLVKGWGLPDFLVNIPSMPTCLLGVKL